MFGYFIDHGPESAFSPCAGEPQRVEANEKENAVVEKAQTSNNSGSNYLEQYKNYDEAIKAINTKHFGDAGEDDTVVKNKAEREGWKRDTIEAINFFMAKGELVMFRMGPPCKLRSHTPSPPPPTAEERASQEEEERKREVEYNKRKREAQLEVAREYHNDDDLKRLKQLSIMSHHAFVASLDSPARVLEYVTVPRPGWDYRREQSEEEEDVD